MAINLDRLNFDNQGLIPAIVQDAQSKAVLMMAYMSRESLSKTMESGETWFWSRSRKELWHKGATSGNTQKVKDIYADCDGDTLLILVEPQGPACHEGTYTCFQPFGEPTMKAQGKSLWAGESISPEENREPGQPNPLSGAGGQTERHAEATGFDYTILTQLMETIAKRDAERPEGAYTTYLFEKGVDKILKKVGEEASEVIIAAKNRNHDELSWETADLLYHLLVLLREQKMGFDQVLNTLRQRHIEKKGRDRQTK